MTTPLNEIDAAQCELDAIDSSLGEALAAVEATLRVHVRVRISSVVRGEPFQSIAFGKHGGEWQMLVVSADVQRPLRGESREVRARAFAGGHIERLVREAAMSIRAQLDARKAATDAARSTLEYIRASLPGKDT